MHKLLKISALILCISFVIFSKFSFIVNFAILLLPILIFVDLKFLRNVLITFPRDFRFYCALFRAAIKIRNLTRSDAVIPDLLEEQAHRFKDRVVFLHEDSEWSFTRLVSHMNRVANALRQQPNLEPGQVLAVLGASRPEFVATWLGVARAGLVPALLNYNLSGDALVRCAEAAEAVGLIFEAEYEPTVAQVAGHLEANGCHLFRYGTTCTEKGNTVAASDLDNLAASASNQWTAGKLGRKNADAVVYIYTSGTTGLPKPAIITHMRFYLMAMSFHIFLRLTPEDVMYVTLPLYHSAGGCVGVGNAILFGTAAVIRSKFSASAYWTDCARYKVTVVQYIGELCRYLLAQPPRPSDTAHNVRLAVGNGLRPAIWAEFRRRFNLPNIAEFYGATESNANLLNFDNTEGAVGFIPLAFSFLFPVALVRADAQTGELVRDPQTGLCVRCGPGEPGMLVGKICTTDPVRAFRGYVSKTATNKKIAYNVFSKGDSCFTSGDILVKDELGYVFFCDRTGDTFRWRGENVSTAEVEMVVSSALKLADCAVYGVQVPGTEGRCGMATIVVKETEFDPERLWQELAKRLPAYARPLFLRLKSNLELTGTFKVKKQELMQEGFDMSRITDQLFFADSEKGTYVPLTDSLYQNILNSNVRL